MNPLRGTMKKYLLIKILVITFLIKNSLALTTADIEKQIIELHLGNFSCTGLVLNKNTIATAAHCLINPVTQKPFSLNEISVNYFSDERIKNAIEKRIKTNKLVFINPKKVANIESISIQINDYAELKTKNSIILQGVDIKEINKADLQDFVQTSLTSKHPYELAPGYKLAAVSRTARFNRCSKIDSSKSSQLSEFDSIHPYFLHDSPSGYEGIVRKYFQITRPEINLGHINPGMADDLNKSNTLLFFHECNGMDAQGAYLRKGDSGTPVFVVNDQGEVQGYIGIGIGGVELYEFNLYISSIHFF
jgi:V8-like Glu-specific endopeptidase